MMKTKLLIASFTMAMTAVPASANVTFNLSGITFNSLPSGGAPDGTLTGSFTTNDALSMIVGFNIAASANGSFSGFNYTTANSAVTASSLPGQYFQIDSQNSVNELRLYLAAPLTNTGTTINPLFSYEHEPSGGNRFASGMITAASTPAVPEPASWAMMILGMSAVGYAMRRRKVTTRVQFA